MQQADVRVRFLIASENGIYLVNLKFYKLKKKISLSGKKSNKRHKTLHKNTKTNTKKIEKIKNIYTLMEKTTRTL
jgi:hypothetical protein